MYFDLFSFFNPNLFWQTINKFQILESILFIVKLNIKCQTCEFSFFFLRIVSRKVLQKTYLFQIYKLNYKSEARDLSKMSGGPPAAAENITQVSSMPIPPMHYVKLYTDEAVKRGTHPKQRKNYKIFSSCLYFIFCTGHQSHYRTPTVCLVSLLTMMMP